MLQEINHNIGVRIISGGYFDYDQYKLSYMAGEIEQLILTNDDQTLDQWGYPKGYGYSQETMVELQKAIEALRVAQVYVKRVDWLVSGDDGEDCFHQRLASDLKKLGKPQ